MDQLFFIGAGGHGKVAADIAEMLGYASIAFLDEGWPAKKANGCWPVVGVPGPLDQTVFCSIGRNDIREKFHRAYCRKSINLIHPSAQISAHSTMKTGVLVAANAVVNAGVSIGNGVILNTSSSVDHDCVIGDFVHVSPGAHLAGNVQVGLRSWIGIGASIREGVRIGDDVVVGAGAVALNDIESGARVAGVPARSL